MRVFNLPGDERDKSRDQLIGGSVYETEPGNKLWPYHAHHANEEW